MNTISTRVSSTFKKASTVEQFDQINISFHLFPDDHEHHTSRPQHNPAFYPELSKRSNARQVESGIKRMMDIIGSALALVISAPLFLVIALAIKASSKGPIFFRQQRVGHYGKYFTCLKFRSMYVDNDPHIHEDYVKRLIAGEAPRHPSKGNGDAVYKLTKDDRVTRVGAFLRKTSLDEVPQFINVLKGEMSLVGPRPPLAYEVESYGLWHRRRLLEAKPGITGLWQVNGRNRIAFDDMVRLDLTYARTWSPWLDLKILLRTPLAVIQGAH